MRTDGHDAANSRFSQFCERTKRCSSGLNTYFIGRQIFYKMYPIRDIRNVTHSLTQTRVLRRPNGRHLHSDC